MATKKKETLSTKETAEAVGTEPRTLRVFLRASTDYEACGAGKRYAFTASDIPTMKKRFAIWRAEQEQARKERAEKLAAEQAAKAADTTTPDEESTDADTASEDEESPDDAPVEQEPETSKRRTRRQRATVAA